MVEASGIAQSVLEKVAEHTGQLETVVSGSLGKATVVGSKLLSIVGLILTAKDIYNWIEAPTPLDGDDNDVIGG